MAELRLMARNASTSTTGTRIHNSFSLEVAQELKYPVAKILLIWLVISGLLIALNSLLAFGANDAVFAGSLLSLIGTFLILFSAMNSDDHERKVCCPRSLSSSAHARNRRSSSSST
jgi:energy-converting hydrogenase Eha subunit C